MAPELENENRVLRKFPRHHDHFLRVQFCDENGQDLYFNAKIGLDRVHSRFKQVLKEGIRIANRVYQFLGWSHSSLRSRSVWFVAPFSDGGQRHSHLTIIKALGNFEEIFCPARCAARIGQAFSETPFAVPMTDEYGDEIRKVDLADVKSRDGSRVFSDGVGTISRAALDVVADYLPRRKQPPTCPPDPLCRGQGHAGAGQPARRLHHRHPAVHDQVCERRDGEPRDLRHGVQAHLARAQPADDQAPRGHGRAGELVLRAAGEDARRPARNHGQRLQHSHVPEAPVDRRVHPAARAAQASGPPRA